MNSGMQFINNCWIKGAGEKFVSINPATNAVVWHGTSATEQEVNDAVVQSRRAFPAWSTLNLDQRLSFIQQFGEQLTNSREEFAEIISEETGKPLWEAKTEIGAMIGKISISITAYHQRTGHSKTEKDGTIVELQHRPHGVTAVFGPFNFPGHLPNGHIIPALIAGNTVIFKPSELTPKTGEFMVQLWQNAGLPAGVLQLLQGEKNTGVALSNHPGLDGLFFTGSPGVGAALQRNFAKTFGKILALELGGHNPLVVKTLTDIPAAVYSALQSCFISTGQRCTCARKLILVKSDATTQFLKAFIAAAENITLTLDDPAGFMGPVINLQQAKNLLVKQQHLMDKGARVLLQMTQPKPALSYLTPGILEVTGMDVPDEEDFGPLVKVYFVNTLEEAIEEANNTAYGLSAGLISDDENDWQIFQQSIRAGIVNWNKPTTGASGNAPFGGPGASGNYRPGAFYAADYCAYPMASVSEKKVTLPEKLLPGITL